MYIKDYLTYSKNESKRQRMQNRRLLKIVKRNVDITYNRHGRHSKTTRNKIT